MKPTVFTRLAKIPLPALALFVMAGTWLALRWLRREIEHAKTGEPAHGDANLIFDPASGAYKPDNLNLSPQRT